MKKNIGNIIEKKLGISPDYQYKALRSKNIFQANWHRNKFVVVELLASLNQDSRVLDLGIGSGNFELLFANKVKHITGVDYNDEAILFAKRQIGKNKIRNVTLLCKDILYLSSNDFHHKFDVILIIDVLEHVALLEADKLVKKLRFLLTESGEIVIITPNYNSTWVLIEYFLDHLSLAPQHSGCQHVTKYYPRKLNDLFLKNGFKLHRMLTFNHVSFISPSAKLSQMTVKYEMSMPWIGNLIAAVYKIR